MIASKQDGGWGLPPILSLLWAYLGLGPSYRVQENEQRHQGPSQDTVLNLPKGKQECHAEW